jgi:hypothetical protein
MNTLTDLRRTLDRHADDVADPAAVARTAAVHHRVAVVRRRRRAVGTGALALAVLAGSAAVLVPRLTSDAEPAAPVVLGQKAPTTIGSLGYTYRTDGHGESFTGRGSIKVSASARPRLFSWTTDGAAIVRVTLPDGDVLRSTTQGFGDSVVVGPGDQGRLAVRVSTGHVGLASYTLTGAAPAGYTKAGVTYRATVVGSPLLTARIGEPGQSVLHTSFVAPHGWIGLGVMCSALPEGYVLNVSLNGDGRTSGESCDSDGSFDPGAHLGAAFPMKHPGESVRVRAWISKGLHDATPLPAGSVPDLRIGVGVYGPLAQQRVGDNLVPAVAERNGHTWTLATRRTSSGAPLRLPAASADRVAEMAWHTHGSTEVTFGAIGTDAPEGGSFGGGRAGLPGLWVPAGEPVRASLDRGRGSFGIALYERVD